MALVLNKEYEFNQIDICTFTEFTITNPPLFYDRIPMNLRSRKDISKVISYNNSNKGIITNDFFAWALKNNIHYDAIKWFILDFSKQKDQEIKWMIDAIFNHYTIYLDESSNGIKFKFKDTEGNTNVKWYNDFILAGLAYEGEEPPIDIDDLFVKFKLQDNIIDAKLKNIAKYNGEDNRRIMDIINSKKVSILLDEINKCENLYIHWATESLIYFSIVDIVDSVLEVNLDIDNVKNVLYKYVIKDLNAFCAKLAKFDYPNIKCCNISDFCDELISWINQIDVENKEDMNLLELLKQGIKKSKKSKELVFLQGNVDKVLIENFVPLYALRAGVFPNSNLYYDECSIVEKEIEKYINIYCLDKIPKYDFIDSKESKWIQLADMVSGILAAFVAYLNTNNLEYIEKDIRSLNEIQNRNMRLIINLIDKSTLKCKYFDYSSKNYIQSERMQFLRFILFDVL